MGLSKCKHCGGEAAIQEETNIIQNYYGISCWQVKCTTCGIRTGYGKKQEVIDAWNKEPAIKINYDLVKGYTIKQMANLFSKPFCPKVDYTQCAMYDTCVDCYIHWLQEEVNND